MPSAAPIFFLFLLFFNLSFFPTICSSSEAAVATVSVHIAKDLLASGHRFLDVRTKEEFIKGHVEDAVNIPYLFFTPEGRKQNPRFIEEVSAVYSKDDHILVGCRSGVRSLNASIDLLKANFKNVKNMEGGFVAWLENRFNVRIPEDEF
ncbi:thiosulfate sulfurtransferase 16, chloroplastic-like [Nymphaea colorata]|nr:thiosulfate sulfurtransferase 16, chloroplastic-like [Nymphaea colorata]